MDFGEYEMFMKTVIKKIEYEKNLFMKAFRKFDKNGDGSVSYEELKEVFLARGKSEKDVQDFFNEADLNKDGRVDYEGRRPFASSNIFKITKVKLVYLVTLIREEYITKGVYLYVSFRVCEVVFKDIER